MTPFDYLILFLMSLGSALAATYMKYYHAPQALELPSEPLNPITPTPMTTAPEKVYEEASSLLGKHLSLNDSVSPEVGCAEAVSFLLKNCGYPIPQGGIVGVVPFIQWMQERGFKEIVDSSQIVPGCVITAHPRGAAYSPNAHIGIVLRYGIGSNDSRPKYLGRFMENYRDVDAWKRAFSTVGAETRLWLPV